jgi:hypothetical protein
VSDPVPCQKVTRTGGKEGRLTSSARHPIAFKIIHIAVQSRAAFESGICPVLAGPKLIVLTGWIAAAPIIKSTKWPLSEAVGVGQDEHAATPVACACFARREQPRFWSVTQSAKAFAHVGTSQIEVAFDVFGKDPFGANFADDSGDVGPQMAGVIRPFPEASKAEWLAGITGSEDMNASTPRRAIEGFKIVPNRRLIQGRVCHPRHESSRGMGFPLDVTDSAISGVCDV